MKSVRDLWSYTLKELRLMTTPWTWEMLFCSCVPLPPEGDVFVIGTRSRYAQEWLQFRFYKLPQDVLSCALGRPVEVKVVLLD